MPPYITFKEAQEKLSNAAYWLATPVKYSLEVWLQAAEDLPHPVQHAHTAAAIHLVQTALQQAPWPMAQHNKLAWLQTHLPQTCAAIQQSLTTQLNISARRVSVLQSLVKQQTDDGQLLPRIEAEVKTYLLLEVLWWVYFLILPVAALADGFVRFHQARDNATYTGQRQRQQRLQDGNNLLSEVAYGLGVAGGIPGDLQRVKDSIKDRLEELGMPQPDWGMVVLNNIFRMKRLVCVAGIGWIHLLSELPSGHPDLVHFLSHVDWSLLCMAALGQGCQSWFSWIRPAVCRVVAQPHIIEELNRWLPPHFLRDLLQEFNLTVEDLQDAGMPAEQAQQLVISLEGVPPTGEPNAFFGLCMGKSFEECFGEEDGGDGDARAEADAGSEVVVEVDSDSNDMNALLRMMYGTSV